MKLFSFLNSAFVMLQSPINVQSIQLSEGVSGAMVRITDVLCDFMNTVARLCNSRAIGNSFPVPSVTVV